MCYAEAAKGGLNELCDCEAEPSLSHQADTGRVARPRTSVVKISLRMQSKTTVTRRLGNVGRIIDESQYLYSSVCDVIQRVLTFSCLTARRRNDPKSKTPFMWLTD